MTLFNPYRANGTWIANLDPRTKLAWLVLIMGVTFMAANGWQLIIVLGSVLLVYRLGKLEWGQLRLSFFALLIMAIQIMVFQLLFRQSGDYYFLTPWLKIDRLGALTGVISTLRLACLVLSAMVFFQLTHPTDLSLLVMKGGVNYRYAMLIGLAVRFLPLMERELGAIFEAQQARGLPLSGAWQKLKGLIPVALPFLFRAFKRSQTTALAMELLGFGLHKERTFLRSLHMDLRDYLLIMGFSLTLVGTSVWQIIYKI